MTYDALEKSTFGGKPVELYKFTSGATIWRFTDGDVDVAVGPETYSAGWPISRTEPEMSDETTRSALKVHVARDFPIALMFASGAPLEPIWLSLYRKHIGDSETILIWQGRVRGVSWKASKGEATIECDPVEKVLGKGGFRQTYGPHCHKRLYSARCGISEANFKTDAVITEILNNGFTLKAPEIASKPNSYFRLGEIYFPALSARALVLEHVGDYVTLRAPISGLAVGAKGHLVAGCNHVWKNADGSWGDCRSKFNNTDNFGGWPYVPTKNPYSVSIEG